MKKVMLIFGMAFATGVSFQTQAQCSAGQVAVSLEVITDEYSEEGYWEIVPSGNACGVGTVMSGGNTSQLNCSSGGGNLTSTTGNGYASASTINVPYTCLTAGAAFDLKYIDDYGDGGFQFKIKIGGYVIETFSGNGATQSITFIANEPPNYDLSSSMKLHTTLVQKNFVTPSENILFMANVSNPGKQTINSLRFNYQVDGGAVQSNTISGLNLVNYSDTVLQSTIPFSSTQLGNYNVHIWMDNLNVNHSDSISANDTVLKVLTVGNPIPNLMSSFIGYWLMDSTVVGSGNQVSTPTDIDFHPNLSRKEMWVLNKNTEMTGGSTVVVSNTGTANQSSIYAVDGNNMHFMSMPTAIAFGENENFGTSPGVLDANHDGGDQFTGPTLWTSDLSIYGGPALGNGDHLDMLHESPYSQGIAWETENVYWVFDGYNNDIVRYDFADDHDPGNSDHSDGIIHRYADFSVAKDPANVVPSHLVIDANKQWLYIVDHNNQRVMRIDITSGTLGGTPSFGPHEDIHEYLNVTGYTYETVVNTGLNKPCGIDIIDEILIVSDYQSNEIIFYDVTAMPATLLYRVAIPNCNGLMGIKIGPDGYIYAVDHGHNRVIKLKPTTSNGLSDMQIGNNISIYPNPTRKNWQIQNADGTVIQSYVVYNLQGEIITEGVVNSSQFSVESSELTSGVYFLQLNIGEGSYIHKIIKE